MNSLEEAVHQARRAVEAHRPKDVAADAFLHSLIDSFDFPEQSAREAAKARVLARGVLERKKIEQEEGGSISSDEAADRLGLGRRQSVDYQRRARALVAWRTTAGKYRFPVWQFAADGTLLPGIRECLAALDTNSGFGAMIFFLSPRLSLAGRRPLDLLRDGDVAAAVEAARRHDRHGA